LRLSCVARSAVAGGRIEQYVHEVQADSPEPPTEARPEPGQTVTAPDEDQVWKRVKDRYGPLVPLSRLARYLSSRTTRAWQRCLRCGGGVDLRF
jgi:hypothetical protein